MQPRPRAETSRPLFPSLRFCIVFSLGTVSLISRLESGAVTAVSRSFRSIACFSCTVDPRTERAVIMGVEVSAVVTMKHRSGEASLLPDQAHELRAELARKIALSVGSEEIRATEIFGLTLGRRTATTARCSMTYEPSVIVIAQGRNRVDLAPTIFISAAPSFLRPPP